MGKQLLAESEVFRTAVEECDAALCPLTGWSVREVLAGVEEPPLDRVDVVQPALFAMAIGLTEVWRSWGVEPAAVVGHSQGEVVAAVVSGALDLEQGARVVAERSRAVQQCTGQGGMALVERSVAIVEELIEEYGDELSVGAVNTSGSTVVSGTSEAIEHFVARMSEQDVYCKQIRVDYASHNAQMDPLLPELAMSFSDLVPQQNRIPFYSTVTGEITEGTSLGSQYWCRNLREPVRFDKALDLLLSDGHDMFIEMSAHPVLSMPLNDACAEHGAVVTDSLIRDQGGHAPLLRSLGTLHAHGYEVDWTRVLDTAHGDLIELPTYAFQRTRYWMDKASTGTDPGSLGLVSSGHPWLGVTTELADGAGTVLSGLLSLREFPWLRDHAVFGSVLVPGTGLLEIALAAGVEVGAPRVGSLTLSQPLVLAEDEAARVQVRLGPFGEGRRFLEIYSQSVDDDTWALHATGELLDQAPDAQGFAGLAQWPASGATPVDLDGFYDRFEQQGLEYGEAFRGVTELWRHGDTAYGLVRLPDGVAAEGYGVHPAVLDAALHVMKAVSAGQDTEQKVLLPFEWSCVDLHATGSTELRVRIDVGADSAKLWVADAAGEPVVSAAELVLRAASAEQVRAGRSVDHLYRTEHQAVPLGERAQQRRTVVLGSAGAVAGALDVPEVSTLDEILELAEEQRPDRILIDVSDADRAESTAADALEVLQTALAEPRLHDTELVWVTGRDATGVGLAPGLAGAAVRGLLRTARTEHPERVTRSIELDSAPGADAIEAALAVSGEPELVVRGQAVSAPRLARVRVDADAERGWQPDPQGTVLITGGTGELGRAVAKHVVHEYGVRHLVLTSRQGQDAPGAANLVEELTEAGAQRVRVLACDAGRREDLAEVLALAEEGHPWTAVLHLAGVLDDGVLSGQDSKRLSNVMAPKVGGALHLHELTADLDLSAFVLFSSAAGTLGSAGQSTYAAANSVLDTLADERQRHGGVGTSLAWGLWKQSGVGLTAHLGEAELDRMRRQGVVELSVEQGLALFDAAMRKQPGNFVPAKLDLRQLQREVDDTGEVPALFRGLLRAPLRKASTADASVGSFGERLAALSEQERREFVLRLVQREIGGVVGASSANSIAPDQVLKELGLDSLMAVELRRRLSGETGLSLPTTLAFDYPTPEAIAEHVLEKTVVAEAEPAQQGSTVTRSDIDGLAELLRAATPEQLESLGLSGRIAELKANLTDEAPDADSETELESGSRDDLLSFLDRKLGVL